MIAIDPLTALAFSLFENKGVYALLLGSGLSRSAQIPTGWEITLDLIRRAAELEGIHSAVDWAAWYRGKFGKEPNYSEILDVLAGSPDERRSILHSYIEPTPEDISEGRKVPTKAHHAIAWLAREGFLKVIVTTNFDRLMENALREAGVEPTVIRSEDDIVGAIPLIHSRCMVVKLHGDYLDSRIKNTDEELSTYGVNVDSLLDRILDDHGLIVCGWSGDWDHALRAAISRTPNRRYPTFWASRGAVSAKAEDLIQQRAAKLIPIAEADQFFPDLQEKIATQIDSQRPDPRSTELLIATVKRYLSRPEFRIQLNDLISDEYRNIFKRLKEPEFAVQGSWSIPEFRHRVARCEQIVESLARALGIMGRWGGELSDRIAGEIIGNLAYAPPESGLVVWSNLRTYPAVLLWYAYGMGLLRAGRYESLFRWLTLSIRKEDRSTKSAVEMLLLGSWSGDDRDVWQQLEGFERRKTPLSDRLHDVSATWSGDYTLTNSEHTRLFEEFEVMGAIAFLTVTAEKVALQEAISSKSGDRNFVWAPVGRTLWNSEVRSLIFTELEQGRKSAEILKAGFANKDLDYLTLSLESLRRIMGRLEWRF